MLVLFHGQEPEWTSGRRIRVAINAIGAISFQAPSRQQRGVSHCASRLVMRRSWWRISWASSLNVSPARRTSSATFIALDGLGKKAHARSTDLELRRRARSARISSNAGGFRPPHLFAQLSRCFGNDLFLSTGLLFARPPLATRTHYFRYADSCVPRLSAKPIPERGRGQHLQSQSFSSLPPSYA
jgi:hypothetical protein